MQKMTPSTTVLAAALIAALSVPVLAQDALQLMFGAAEGRRVSVAFSPDKAGAEAIVVTAHQVGVAGSRLALSIDRSRNALIDRILATEDCKFDDKGSVCSFAIPGDAPEYAAVVDAFKRGLTLHIEVTNAGSMEMSEDISLQGFTKAYGEL